MFDFDEDFVAEGGGGGESCAFGVRNRDEEALPDGFYDFDHYFLL